ncbi:Cytoplasmic dynein 1 light intermediate chain 1 [Diplonema papillatum]|nr:Cytoplasmic dynein 1 light intermediate chain 1 [Diplonema papillatum]
MEVDGEAGERERPEEVVKQERTDTGREESLWEKVLREHRENASAAKARDVYQLFVVGDRADGKELTLKWLRQHTNEDDDEEEDTPPSGLGFAYGEWKEKPIDEDEEATVRVLQTVIEKPGLKFLLPAFFLGGTLKQRNLETTVFAIAVDLSVPHRAMERLNEWYKFLTQCVADIVGDDRSYLNHLTSRMEAQCDAFHTDPRQLVKKKETDDCLEVLTSPRDLGRASATYKKMGIFNKGNLGVPLIVMCTKAKLLDPAAQAYTKDPKEREHFLTYVQASLRKWCIERGAALIYTDGEKQASYTLKEYLLYRLAGIPMSSMLDERLAVQRRVPSATISHTKLFVPAFADSLPQVAKLQTGRYADAPWDQVVPPPKKLVQETEAETPDSFMDWLGKERKKAKEGGLLGPSVAPTRRARVSDQLRDTGNKREKSLEATAESFFTNMIKTYKRQDGTRPGNRTKPTSSGTTSTPNASP